MRLKKPRSTQDKNNMKIKKSQSFSVDFIIAIVVFMGVIILFYQLLNPGTEPKTIELQEEAALVARHTEEQTSPLSILDEDTVDEVKLQTLVDSVNEEGGYEALKSELGIINDFCIYFEDDKR